MSAAVNFSSLSSYNTLGGTDQLLVRLDNSLSGTSGFGRITKTNLLSDRLPVSGGTITGNLSITGTTTTTLSAATYIANFTNYNLATKTLSLSDSSKTILDSYASGTTFIIPANNTTAFTIGTQINVIQGFKGGTYYTSFSAASGVTVNSFNSSLSLGGDYAAGTLVKTGTNTWYLIGNLL